jgi:queuine tRNA-ribosyltransferase
MGVGMPADIIAAVMAGVDMFDCVLPTRNGRNAYAFTMAGPLRMRNNAHISDSGPIEKDCDCCSCRSFSRAAIRHFFNVGEMLGPILTSIHNLRFYQRLMTEIRRQIEKGALTRWADRQTRDWAGYSEPADDDS